MKNSVPSNFGIYCVNARKDAKMPLQITNNNVVYSKFCAISKKKKKRSSYTETAKTFLYQHTLKQMKQKRSSGNAVHFFLRLSVLLHQISKKHRWTLRRMKKKWRCAGRYSQTKTPKFQKSKNAVCSRQKVMRKCSKKFRTICTFLRLQGTLLKNMRCVFVILATFTQHLHQFANQALNAQCCKFATSLQIVLLQKTLFQV